MTDEGTPPPQTVHVDLSWVQKELFAMPNPLDEQAIRAAAYQAARERLLQLAAANDGERAQGLLDAVALLAELERPAT